MPRSAAVVDQQRDARQSSPSTLPHHRVVYRAAPTIAICAPRQPTTAKWAAGKMNAQAGGPVDRDQFPGRIHRYWRARCRAATASELSPPSTTDLDRNHAHRNAPTGLTVDDGFWARKTMMLLTKATTTKWMAGDDRTTFVIELGFDPSTLVNQPWPNKPPNVRQFGHRCIFDVLSDRTFEEDQKWTRKRA